MALSSYLALIPPYEKAHRKSNRISVVCIVLSVLLVTAIFSMAEMALRAQKNYFIKTNGEYHISLTGIDRETAELIASRVDVALCGWVCQGSSGTIGGHTVSFAGAGREVFSALTEMQLESGAYPAHPDEALLNHSALEQLGLAPGGTVTVAVPDGSRREYRITGVLADMGSLLKADVYGMVLTEEGFRQIADENAADGTTFRVQFKDGVHIQRAMDSIREQFGLADSQISENTALLGLMGQSENSTMQSLYIVAGALFLLVLTAGAVMIAASFNTNVLERVQFYGLLRCLGATKPQVRRFVIVQGLRQSLKGVPLGLVAGQFVTWGACLLLRSISGERFSEIPLFQFSVSGLAAGALVGFLIVLLAALSPARRASKVSPITAVSGSSQLARNERAVRAERLPIEIRLGVFHALSGKKNLFLMTCSFAVSIMMFLSFQVLVVFLDQGMPALSPSAADVSITGDGAPLYRTLADRLRKTPGVAHVFGRMEATELSLSSRLGESTVTLLSYDDLQFGWAKQDLNRGSIAPVQENIGAVLAVYQNGTDWQVGDSAVLHTPSGDRTVTVAGVLASVSAGAAHGADSTMICSEQTFAALMGDTGYAAVDVQLAPAGGDDTVAAIRELVPPGSTVSDKRITNAEAQSSYYTGAVFIYGFLVIIALITVFNIFNSMNASVASRTRQYGVMRSIGMSVGQLDKVIAAEAFTYALLGCAAGCVLGLPLNRLAFQFLIADKWGTPWQVPAASLLLIVALCLASAALAIRRPMRLIGQMTVVDTIKQQQ